MNSTNTAERSANACRTRPVKLKIALWATVLLFILTALPIQAQTFQLYQSTRTNGSIQELDLTTGAILATNVGGVTGARGMAFSPLGGLYYCVGNSIGRLATAASSPTIPFFFLTENPHDIDFDAVGNMYVVTETMVHIISPALVTTLAFAHGMTTTTGDGNANKGWSIKVRPDNGEIYVAARQGLRRFDPVTGLQIGGTIAGSSNGMIGIGFTFSNFNNALVYVGNVISGVDQVRVYDTNLNFLRTFFPPHIGNPIDLEVHPINGDIYLFNTVVSLPVNRLLSNETVVNTFNMAANASRGSALGDFSGFVLPDLALNLSLEENDGLVQLQWLPLGEAAVDHYRVTRVDLALQRTELGRVTAESQGDKFTFADLPPAEAHLRYVVTAIGQNGAEIAHESVQRTHVAATPMRVLQDAQRQVLHLRAQDPNVVRMSIRLTDMRGALVQNLTVSGQTATLPYADLSTGIYVLQAIGYTKDGAVAQVTRQRVRL